MESNNSSQEPDSVDLSKYIHLCNGCNEDQPNQLAHINCPDGCLHDKEECSYCDTSDDEN